MNEHRLAQLLRDADGGDSTPLRLRDVSGIAMTARSIRLRRQQRARLISATLSVLFVIGSVTAMIGWRNISSTRVKVSNPSVALREQVDRLDGEADQRMGAIQAVARSTKSQLSKTGKTKTPVRSRDVSMELGVQRERAAAIILQAADQLRDAGRSDFANDRYHDLITLFPDTAAAQLAGQRIEQTKNRT